MNIFVSGTYGVGKTTLCSKLTNYLGLPHFSASQIIGHHDITKEVEDARLNQKLLVEGVFELNKKYPSIILDGHFCIVENNQIIRLPLHTFDELQIQKVLILIDEPNSISSRLTIRGGQQFNVETILELQDAELEQANKYYSKYGASLMIINAKQIDIGEIKNFIFK